MFEYRGGLPHQCEHWLAMTWFFDSLTFPGGEGFEMRSAVTYPSICAATPGSFRTGGCSFLFACFLRLYEFLIKRLKAFY